MIVHYYDDMGNEKYLEFDTNWDLVSVCNHTECEVTEN